MQRREVKIIQPKELKEMGTKQAHHMWYLFDEIPVSHNQLFQHVTIAAINHNMKPI